nr:hypothetical protein FFPRI1PSEUD_34210 [Pseudomonas sp. FFPRI_1]
MPCKACSDFSGPWHAICSLPANTGPHAAATNTAPCRSWLASEDIRKDDTRLKGLFAGKPAPTGNTATPRRSWLASEGVRKGDARLKGLFAGKPAPTGNTATPRRSWLASEGVRNGDTRLKGLFAGKPAPTGNTATPVGAGLPAKASARATQGSRAQVEIRSGDDGKHF